MCDVSALKNTEFFYCCLLG